jgi:hypothetical protein
VINLTGIKDHAADRFVAAIVHTVNAAIAAVDNISTLQQPQQTGLICNDSVYA